MKSSPGTVIICARDVHKIAAFHAKHFGFSTTGNLLRGRSSLSRQMAGREYWCMPPQKA
jgi:hypothetical protein